MRRTLEAAAVAVALAFIAVSAFAATPSQPVQKPIQSFTDSQRTMLQLADEIFVARPVTIGTPQTGAYPWWGYCSATCDRCNTAADCPSYGGLHQFCMSQCP